MLSSYCYNLLLLARSSAIAGEYGRTRTAFREGAGRVRRIAQDIKCCPTQA